MTTKQTLLDSPPVLQNPTPHSVTVTWAVNGPATGWVEYGETSALGKRADAAIFGQHVYSSRFLRISLTGLEAGKTIFLSCCCGTHHLSERFSS